MRTAYRTIRQPLVVTTGEVATILGMRRDQVRGLIERGELTGFRRGRDWRLDPFSVEAFLRKNGAAAAAAALRLRRTEAMGDVCRMARLLAKRQGVNLATKEGRQVPLLRLHTASGSQLFSYDALLRMSQRGHVRTAANTPIPGPDTSDVAQAGGLQRGNGPAWRTPVTTAAHTDGQARRAEREGAPPSTPASECDLQPSQKHST